MKMMLNIIPTNIVANSLLSFFFLSQKSKPVIKFSATWWSGNEKLFCFLFIANRALRQKNAEFNRLLQKDVIPAQIIVPR